jgi:hypothetical protein
MSRLAPPDLWRTVLATGGVVAVTALLWGCQRPAPPAAQAPAAPAYNVTLSMKEVMGHVVDPGAWAFWRASGTVTSETGEQSLTPTTEQGWESAESGAAQIAESGNLLLLPGRKRDDGDWATYARTLSRQGLEAKAAVEARDTRKMFESGAAIYQTCTGCHAKYVMPYLPPSSGKPTPLPDWPADVRARQAAHDATKH